MRVALLCCVVGLAAACGDDGVDVNTSASNFCSEIADVICHNMYQCCTEAEIENELGVSEPRTENQCREDLKRACDRSSQELRDSLEAGRVQLDAARLNDCLNAVVAPDGVCGDVVEELPWSEACSTTPWVGTVQPMGSCFFDFDCAGWPDADCGPDQKCKLKPTAGFPCTGGCASDYYCVTLTQTCAAKSDLGGMCTQDDQCNNKKDLYCNYDQMTMMGTCAARGSAGTTCLKDAACLSFDCVPGMCAGTQQSCFSDAGCFGRCADDNSFCDESADCGVGNCTGTSGTCFDDTNYCGICVGGSNPGVPCANPSVCIGGTCDGAASAGDYCLFAVQCVPGDCVGDPVCTAPLRVTDYCDAVGVIPSP